MAAAIYSCKVEKNQGMHFDGQIDALKEEMCVCIGESWGKLVQFYRCPLDRSIESLKNAHVQE